MTAAKLPFLVLIFVSVAIATVGVWNYYTYRGEQETLMFRPGTVEEWSEQVNQKLNDLNDLSERLRLVATCTLAATMFIFGAISWLLHTTREKLDWCEYRVSILGARMCMTQEILAMHLGCCGQYKYVHPGEFTLGSVGAHSPDFEPELWIPKMMMLPIRISSGEPEVRVDGEWLSLRKYFERFHS